MLLPTFPHSHDAFHVFISDEPSRVPKVAGSFAVARRFGCCHRRRRPNMDVWDRSALSTVVSRSRLGSCKSSSSSRFATTGLSATPPLSTQDFGHRAAAAQPADGAMFFHV